MRCAVTRSMLFALLLAPSVLVAQEPGQRTPTPAAVEPPSASERSNPVGPAPADKGLIVFFREPNVMGAAMGVMIRNGGNAEVGSLRNGRYFALTAEPGTHVYGVQGETRDVLKLEVQPGKTYYVQGSIDMGLLAGRPNLSLVDEATFVELAGKLESDK